MALNLPPYFTAGFPIHFIGNEFYDKIHILFLYSMPNGDPVHGEGLVNPWNVNLKKTTHKMPFFT